MSLLWQVMEQRVIFSRKSDEWSTPKALYAALDAEFGFVFDPCPLHDGHGVSGLMMEWGARSFCNPPYSNIYPWMEKGYREFTAGKCVVFLVPSRTDTRWWHEFVMKASEIRFVRGRLRFGESTRNAPFCSSVVIFDGRTRGIGSLKCSTQQ